MARRFILLVEDDAGDVALIQRALRKYRINADLVVVGDGQEALDFLDRAGRHAGRSPGDKLEAIFLDLKLPKLSGWQVLERIRANEETRRVPVVILTSSTAEEAVAKSYDLGANSFITKPVDPNRFDESIQRLGEYWLSINHSLGAGA